MLSQLPSSSCQFHIVFKAACTCSCSYLQHIVSINDFRHLQLHEMQCFYSYFFVFYCCFLLYMYWVKKHCIFFNFFSTLTQSACCDTKRDCTRTFSTHLIQRGMWTLFNNNLSLHCNWILASHSSIQYISHIIKLFQPPII